MVAFVNLVLKKIMMMMMMQSECHPDLPVRFAQYHTSSNWPSDGPWSVSFGHHKSGFLVAVHCRRWSWGMGNLSSSINQSINQSKHICIAPYVANESEVQFLRISCPVHQSCAVRRKDSVPAIPQICNTSVFGFFFCHLTWAILPIHCMRNYSNLRTWRNQDSTP